MGPLQSRVQRSRRRRRGRGTLFPGGSSSEHGLRPPQGASWGGSVRAHSSSVQRGFTFSCLGMHPRVSVLTCLCSTARFHALLSSNFKFFRTPHVWACRCPTYQRQVQPAARGEKSRYRETDMKPTFRERKRYPQFSHGFIFSKGDLLLSKFPWSSGDVSHCHDVAVRRNSTSKSRFSP